MDVGRAGVVRFFNEEIDILHDGRLAGEVARVRQLAIVTARERFAVPQVVHHFYHRFGGRVGAADAVGQFFVADGHELDGPAELATQVIEDFGIGIAGNRDTHVRLGRLQGENVVVLEVLKLKPLSEL